MKRDWELIRAILTALEEKEGYIRKNNGRLKVFAKKFPGPAKSLVTLKLFIFCKLMTCLLLAAFPSTSSALYEKGYQEIWCDDAGGRTEVSMPDGTRCDCLTETHAIEFDFGRKWAEAIGQSLSYAMQTNKRAGIVLILETVKDRKYWIRMNSVIQHYGLPIDAWAIGDGAY